MKKYILPCLVLAFIGSVYAVDIVDRFKGQTIAQGGTSNYNNSTVIESTSPTNAFKVVVVTATVSGAATASTNTFATAFVATPNVFTGIPSGGSVVGVAGVTATATTTTLIVTGLNSAGSTNNLPFLVYGYTRTGKLE